MSDNFTNWVCSSGIILPLPKPVAHNLASSVDVEYRAIGNEINSTSFVDTPQNIFWQELNPPQLKIPGSYLNGKFCCRYKVCGYCPQEMALTENLYRH